MSDIFFPMQPDEIFVVGKKMVVSGPPKWFVYVYRFLCPDNFFFWGGGFKFPHSAHGVLKSGTRNVVLRLYW